MLGQTLGHYRIESKLGEGGMGAVWKARDTRLDRFVALKTLPPEKLADDERRRRFVQEAKAASALNHPNIVHIYDIADADAVPFIAMEYVSGKTLDQLIGRKGLRLNESLKYAIQIADALARAHAAGIIHRDLKPSNIMVDEHGLVKVLDFGLAKLTERLEPENFGPTQTMKAAAPPRTEEGTILGTVAYMSPEQAEAKPIDVRSDIFSFGSMLYEMVTGQRAFRGDSRLSALSAILKEEPEPLSSSASGVPRDLEKIISRCLRKDPARRFQHMDDVKVALEELKEESESGRLESGLPKPAPAARRLRSPAVIAAISVLAAAAAGVTWRLIRPKGPPPSPTLTRLTSDTGLTAYPALSADGKLVAYASDRGGTETESRLDIWVQQTGGGNPLRLTHDPADAREPNFSSDGTKIVFRSERGGGGIYTVSSLGGEERLLAEQGRTPRFSPDGKWIAYWTGDPSQYCRCKTFIIPAAGGSPTEVQLNFYSARYPTWSPDSQHLLFLGAESAERAQADAMDWWVAPLDGGPAVATGAYRFLQSQRALPLINQSLGGYWVGDSIVFAAGAGFQVEDSSNLWRISISPRGELGGAPQRLTSSTALDYQPAGVQTPDHQPLIVFTSGGEHPSIWSLPVNGKEGKVTGRMERLTASAAEDSYPSVTPDGTKIVFISSRSGNPDIWMKDLVTGNESPLTSTPNVREAFPLISPDGSQVAYSVLEAGGPSYIIPTRGGVHKQIAGNTIVEVQCWTPDSKNLVYRKEVTGHAYFVAIDPNTGAETLLLKHSRLPVAAPRYSPDGRWLAFQTVISSTQRQLLIAPLHDGVAGDEKEWIPITDGSGLDRNAAWSLDGNLLYFLSERDGWRCFWGQKLDPATKHPVGPAFAVQHFHQARHSLLSLNEVGAIGLSVGRDRIYFSMPEITGNIWMAKFE